LYQYLGVIFLQDWITWYKTITVGCHQIKLFHTFFAACQNQAVNNTAPPPIWTFPHILEDMETRRHGGEDVYIPFPFGSIIEVKLAVGSEYMFPLL
jgi:hypothetical protein